MMFRISTNKPPSVIKPRLVSALRVVLVLAVATLGTVQLHAQRFQRTYGAQREAARFHPIEVTADGGTIMVGTTQAAGGDKDVYLQKLDVNGVVVWDLILGDVTNDEEGYDVMETRDPAGATLAYVVTGLSVATVGGVPDTSVYLAKVRPNGALIWQYRYGTAIEGYTRIGHALIEIVNAYAVAGVRRNPQALNSSDVLFMTVDTSGTLLLTETIGSDATDEAAYAITDCNSGLGIAGFTMNGTKTDGLIVRVDPATGGILGIPRRYGAAANNDTLYSITTDRGPYFICAGTTAYAPDHMDMLGVEVEIATGNLVWGNTYDAFLAPSFNRINLGADLRNFSDAYGIVGTTSAALDLPGRPNPDYIVLSKLQFVDGSPVAGAARLFGGVNGNNMTSTGYGLRTLGDAGRCLVAGQEDFNVITPSGEVDMYLIRTDLVLNSGCNQSEPLISHEAYTVNASVSLVTHGISHVRTEIQGALPAHWLDNELCFCPFCKHVIEPVDAEAAGTDDLSLAIHTDGASGDLNIHARTPGDGVIEIFDMTGRRVRTLLPSASASGSDAVAWDGADDTGARLPNALYVVQLRASSGVISRPVRIVR